MIYLTTSATLSSVKGFWIVVAALATALVALVYQLFLPSLYFVMACLLFALALVAAALVKPSMLQTTFTICSAIIRNRMVPLARRWVLGVVFFLIILGNRPFGRGMGKRGAGEKGSTWVPKEISHLIGGSHSLDVVVADSGRSAWLSMLLRWIRETRNWWVLGLVPFMMLLSLLDIGRQRSSQSDESYTLF